MQILAESMKYKHHLHCEKLHRIFIGYLPWLQRFIYYIDIEFTNGLVNNAKTHFAMHMITVADKGHSSTKSEITPQ